MMAKVMIIMMLEMNNNDHSYDGHDYDDNGCRPRSESRRSLQAVPRSLLRGRGGNDDDCLKMFGQNCENISAKF